MSTYPHPAHRIPPCCLAVTLGALERLVPRALIATVLTQTGRVTERVRKLDLGSIALLVIALSLFAQESQPHVLRRLFPALRLRWATLPPMPTPQAICYRREELGVAPLRQLFHQVCVPLAAPDTPGAWLAGYRLMAIDGTVEETAAPPPPPPTRPASGDHRINPARGRIRNSAASTSSSAAPLPWWAPACAASGAPSFP